MFSEKRLRAVILAVAMALPAGIYVIGDAVDAFPGIITIHDSSAEPPRNPPASGEDRAAQTAAALPPAESTSPAAADGDAMLRAMTSAADLDAIGAASSFTVVDAETGEVIAQQDGTAARVPASTLKLLTAIAVAREVPLDQRLTTQTQLNGSQLFLVGGGDMMLTVDGTPKVPDQDLPRASLADLADATAADLKQRGVTEVTLHLDDSLFGQDPINPAWGENGPDGGWVAPISAIGLDGGNTTTNPYGAKSADPGMDAATVFAQQLTDRGITVTAAPARATVPDGAEPIARVQSAPIEDLIRHTLVASDNTTAEVLARLLAVRTGKPGTVAGGREAVLAGVTAAASDGGFSISGLRLADVSGLSTDNRVPPELFAHLAAWAATDGPEDVRTVFALVPVGGFNGTLIDRFQNGSSTQARGLVRGKTGYLSGTSSLAGITTLPNGRVIGFTIVVHGFESKDGNAAKDAVDAIAAAMIAGDPAS